MSVIFTGLIKYFDKNQSDKISQMKAVKSYDYYGDYVTKLFFAEKYNKNSSKISIYLDTKESKANFSKALEIIDFDTYLLKEHVCKWTKSKSKDSIEDDYIYFATYYSEDISLCIEVELNNDELSLECYYDWNNKHVEKWCLLQVDKLRDHYGTIKSPEFRVLTKGLDDFETTKIKIKPVEVDISLNYNEDFSEINQLITKSFDDQKSGLILLYGQPGTGKTTYIKYLVQRYNKSKFIFIPNDFIQDLLKPSFVSFLIKQTNAVLVIEDAEKVISNRDSKEGPSVVSTLLQLTDGLFSDYLKIKVICTFNTDTSKIDKALFRKGRMIASYEFKKLSNDRIERMSNRIGISLDKDMTIGDIYNISEKGFNQKESPKIGFK